VDGRQGGQAAGKAGPLDHASLREDYLNQVPRVFLSQPIRSAPLAWTHALKREYEPGILRISARRVRGGPGAGHAGKAAIPQGARIALLLDALAHHLKRQAMQQDHQAAHKARAAWVF